MPQSAPVAAEAVPTLIAEAEKFTTFEPRLPATFAFVWEHRRYDCKVAEDRGGRAVVTVVGDLGPMPYTAENPKARRRYADLLAASRRSDLARFRVGADRHLKMETEGEVERPVTGASVVAAVARTLLQARPYAILAGELGAAEAPTRLRFRQPRRRG